MLLAMSVCSLGSVETSSNTGSGSLTSGSMLLAMSVCSLGSVETSSNIGSGSLTSGSMLLAMSVCSLASVATSSNIGSSSLTSNSDLFNTSSCSISSDTCCLLPTISGSSSSHISDNCSEALSTTLLAFCLIFNCSSGVISS